MQKHLEAERSRAAELAALRQKHAVEMALARQQAESARQARQSDLRQSRATFLPKVAAGFGAVALLGTALILYVLVANGAKDQIPVVLAFLTGVVGGVLAGFGAAKLLPAGGRAPKA